MKQFVLCQHGLLGNERDFRNLAEYFHSLPDRPVEVVILKSSSGVTQTLDGVGEGGIRCMNEIVNLLETGTIPQNSGISFIGHSLGGLYLRHALRQIEIDRPSLWDSFCVNRHFCVFLATPHLGIDCSSWIIRHSVNFLFRHVSRTADDLALRSPILTNLADETGVVSLNRFNRVILYGNLRGDNLVSLSSALLSQDAPQWETDTHTGTIIKEFTPTCISHESEEFLDTRTRILHNLTSGLENLTRYIVQFPPGLPGNLSVVDNTAHHRIICHGILDRGKAGLPVLQHLENLILQSNRN